MKTRWIILWVCCAPFMAWAQADYTTVDAHAGKVPWPASWSVKKLSQTLTEPYDDEALKVRSIFHWMRSHIRYDAAAYMKDKRKRHSPAHILIRKKALCLGFAELFKALCAEAGIEAQVVVGYDKGSSYEPHDIFIRDDHAWNAVRIHGQWKLLDLSWSGGYMEARKQTLRRRLHHWFGLPYRPRKKFVKAPMEDYYLTPPETFVKDHLPSHCWWQLLAMPVPVAVFERDSVEVFLAHPARFPGFDCHSADSILLYAGLEEKESVLRGAQSAFRFNPNNHRVMAEGYHRYAVLLGNETGRSEMSHEEKIEQYDTAVVRLKTARDHYQEYKRGCREELGRRKTRNQDFHKASKKAIDDQVRLNSRLMKALSRHKGNLERGHVQLKQLNQSLEQENALLQKMNLEQIRRARRETDAEKRMERDRLWENMALNRDTARQKLQEDSAITHRHIPDLYALMRKDRSELEAHWDRIQGAIQARTFLRQFFSLRMENVVNQISDSLNYLKMHGTFLSNSVREELYESIANQKKKLKENHKVTRDLLRKNMDLLRKIKKMSEEDLGEDSLYQQQVRQLMEENRRKISGNMREMEQMTAERDAAIREKKKLWLENRLLQKEKTIELQRLAAFNRKYKDFHSRELRKTVKWTAAVRQLTTEYKTRITKHKDAVRKEAERSRQ